MHLFHLPKFVIKRIDATITKILWVGVGNKQSIHLAYLESISKNETKGKWDFIDTNSFNLFLHIKNLWRSFFGFGKWHRIISKKYVNFLNMEEWVQLGAPKKKNGYHLFDAA